MDSPAQVTPAPLPPPARPRTPFFTHFLRALILVGLVGIWAWGRWSPSSPWRVQPEEWAPLAFAPAPLPTALPLRGPEGKDLYGYPTQYIDRGAFRALLHGRKFDDLDRYFDELQTAFEEDFHKEYWVNDAVDSFDGAEPALDTELDAWVTARPRSAAALLARGSHLVDRGFARRGGEWASLTSKEQFRGMAEAFRRATADLEGALALRPRLVAAMRHLIRMERVQGTSQGRGVGARVEAVCPACFQVRVVEIYTRTPRWGGSYEAMGALAARAPIALNPKLKLLPGYVDADRAAVALLEKHPDEALVAIERACALGDHWDFFHERSKIHRARKELDKALSDHDHALALRPGHPFVLFERAHTLDLLDREEEAARDLLASLHLVQIPQHAWLIDAVARDLQIRAEKLQQQGQRDDALRLYDLAVELSPQDRGAAYRRMEAVREGTGKGPEGLARATAEAKAAPDDFRAQQRLDYLLASERNFAPVVALWGDFLARHPDHARAYLERAGALHNLGQNPQAIADLTRACDLGLTESCERLASLGR